MSKGYSSEDAQERIQRAREARMSEADEEAARQRALAAAREHLRGASEPLVVIDRSEVREGQLPALASAIRELVAFVEANEPRTVAYQMHLSPDGRTLTVLQVHPDSTSMEEHMRLAAPLFSKFGPLLRLTDVHVYGRPSAVVVEQLRRKAELLGNATLVVHPREAGFARFGGR